MLTTLSLIMSVNIFILCFVFSEMNFLKNTNSFPSTKDIDIPQRFLEEETEQKDLGFCFYYKDTISIANATGEVYLEQNGNTINCNSKKTEENIYKCDLSELKLGNLNVYVDGQSYSIVSTNFVLDSSMYNKTEHKSLILNNVKCKPQNISLKAEDKEFSLDEECVFGNEQLVCSFENLTITGNNYSMIIKYHKDDLFLNTEYTLDFNFTYYSNINENASSAVEVILPKETNRTINQIKVKFNESLNETVDFVELSKNFDSVTLVVDKNDTKNDYFIQNENGITIQVDCTETFIFSLYSIYFKNFSFINFNYIHSFGYFFSPLSTYYLVENNKTHIQLMFTNNNLNKYINNIFIDDNPNHLKCETTKQDFILNCTVNNTLNEDKSLNGEHYIGYTEVKISSQLIVLFELDLGEPLCLSNELAQDPFEFNLSMEFDDIKTSLISDENDFPCNQKQDDKKNFTCSLQNIASGYYNLQLVIDGETPIIVSNVFKKYPSYEIISITPNQIINTKTYNITIEFAQNIQDSITLCFSSINDCNEENNKTLVTMNNINNSTLTISLTDVNISQIGIGTVFLYYEDPCGEGEWKQLQQTITIVQNRIVEVSTDYLQIDNDNLTITFEEAIGDGMEILFEGSEGSQSKIVESESNVVTIENFNQPGKYDIKLKINDNKYSSPFSVIVYKNKILLKTTRDYVVLNSNTKRITIPLEYDILPYQIAYITYKEPNSNKEINITNYKYIDKNIILTVDTKYDSLTIHEYKIYEYKNNTPSIFTVEVIRGENLLTTTIDIKLDNPPTIPNNPIHFLFPHYDEQEIETIIFEEIDVVTNEVVNNITFYKNCSNEEDCLSINKYIGQDGKEGLTVNINYDGTTRYKYKYKLIEISDDTFTRSFRNDDYVLQDFEIFKDVFVLIDGEEIESINTDIELYDFSVVANAIPNIKCKVYSNVSNTCNGHCNQVNDTTKINCDFSFTEKEEAEIISITLTSADLIPKQLHILRVQLDEENCLSQKNDDTLKIKVFSRQPIPDLNYTLQSLTNPQTKPVNFTQTTKDGSSIYNVTIEIKQTDLIPDSDNILTFIHGNNINNSFSLDNIPFKIIKEDLANVKHDLTLQLKSSQDIIFAFSAESNISNVETIRLIKINEEGQQDTPSNINFIFVTTGDQKNCTNDETTKLKCTVNLSDKDQSYLGNYYIEYTISGCDNTILTYNETPITIKPPPIVLESLSPTEVKLESEESKNYTFTLVYLYDIFDNDDNQIELIKVNNDKRTNYTLEESNTLNIKTFNANQTDTGLYYIVGYYGEQKFNYSDKQILFYNNPVIIEPTSRVIWQGESIEDITINFKHVIIPEQLKSVTFNDTTMNYTFNDDSIDVPINYTFNDVGDYPITLETFHGEKFNFTIIVKQVVSFDEAILNVSCVVPGIEGKENNIVIQSQNYQLNSVTNITVNKTFHNNSTSTIIEYYSDEIQNYYNDTTNTINLPILLKHNTFYEVIAIAVNETNRTNITDNTCKLSGYYLKKIFYTPPRTLSFINLTIDFYDENIAQSQIEHIYVNNIRNNNCTVGESKNEIICPYNWEDKTNAIYLNVGLSENDPNPLHAMLSPVNISGNTCMNTNATFNNTLNTIEVTVHTVKDFKYDLLGIIYNTNYNFDSQRVNDTAITITYVIPIEHRNRVFTLGIKLDRTETNTEEVEMIQDITVINDVEFSTVLEASYLQKMLTFNFTKHLTADDMGEIYLNDTKLSCQFVYHLSSDNQVYKCTVPDEILQDKSIYELNGKDACGKDILNPLIIDYFLSKRNSLIKMSHKGIKQDQVNTTYITLDFLDALREDDLIPTYIVFERRDNTSKQCKVNVDNSFISSENSLSLIIKCDNDTNDIDCGIFDIKLVFPDDESKLISTNFFMLIYENEFILTNYFIEKNAGEDLEKLTISLINNVTLNQIERIEIFNETNSQQKLNNNVNFTFVNETEGKGNEIELTFDSITMDRTYVFLIHLMQDNGKQITFRLIPKLTLEFSITPKYIYVNGTSSTPSTQTITVSVVNENNTFGNITVFEKSSKVKLNQTEDNQNEFTYELNLTDSNTNNNMPYIIKFYYTLTNDVNQNAINEVVFVSNTFFFEFEHDDTCVYNQQKKVEVKITPTLTEYEKYVDYNEITVTLSDSTKTEGFSVNLTLSTSAEEKGVYYYDLQETETFPDNATLKIYETNAITSEKEQHLGEGKLTFTSFVLPEVIYENDTNLTLSKMKCKLSIISMYFINDDKELLLSFNDGDLKYEDTNCTCSLSEELQNELKESDIYGQVNVYENNGTTVHYGNTFISKVIPQGTYTASTVSNVNDTIKLLSPDAYLGNIDNIKIITNETSEEQIEVNIYDKDTNSITFNIDPFDNTSTYHITHLNGEELDKVVPIINNHKIFFTLKNETIYVDTQKESVEFELTNKDPDLQCKEVQINLNAVQGSCNSECNCTQNITEPGTVIISYQHKEDNYSLYQLSLNIIQYEFESQCVFVGESKQTVILTFTPEDLVSTIITNVTINDDDSKMFNTTTPNNKFQYEGSFNETGETKVYVNGEETEITFDVVEEFKLKEGYTFYKNNTSYILTFQLVNDKYTDPNGLEDRITLSDNETDKSIKPNSIVYDNTKNQFKVTFDINAIPNATSFTLLIENDCKLNDPIILTPTILPDIILPNIKEIETSINIANNSIEMNVTFEANIGQQLLENKGAFNITLNDTNTNETLAECTNIEPITEKILHIQCDNSTNIRDANLIITHEEGEPTTRMEHVFFVCNEHEELKKGKCYCYLKLDDECTDKCPPGTIANGIDEIKTCIFPNDEMKPEDKEPLCENGKIVHGVEIFRLCKCNAGYYGVSCEYNNTSQVTEIANNIINNLSTKEINLNSTKTKSDILNLVQLKAQNKDLNITGIVNKHTEKAIEEYEGKMNKSDPNEHRTIFGLISLYISALPSEKATLINDTEKKIVDDIMPKISVKEKGYVIQELPLQRVFYHKINSTIAAMESYRNSGLLHSSATSYINISNFNDNENEYFLIRKKPSDDYKKTKSTFIDMLFISSSSDKSRLLTESNDNLKLKCYFAFDEYITNKNENGIYLNKDLAVLYGKKGIDIYDINAPAFTDKCFFTNPDKFKYDLTQKYRKNYLYPNIHFTNKLVDDTNNNKEYDMTFEYFNSTGYSVIDCSTAFKQKKNGDSMEMEIRNELVSGTLDDVDKVYALPLRCVGKVEKVHKNIAFWLYFALALLLIAFIVVIMIRELVMNYDYELVAYENERKFVQNDVFVANPPNPNTNNNGTEQERQYLRSSSNEITQRNRPNSEAQVVEIDAEDKYNDIHGSNRQATYESNYNLDNKVITPGDITPTMKPSFVECLINNFLFLHPIMFMLYHSWTSPQMLNAWIVIFTITTLFGFNAVYFNESLIEKRIYNNNRNNFAYPMKEEAGVCFAAIFTTVLFTVFARFIVLSTVKTRRNLIHKYIDKQKITLDKVQDNTGGNFAVNEYKKEREIRKGIACLIMGVLMLFFWVYCIGFCGMYTKAQFGWFYLCIWALLFDWVLFAPVWIVVISILETTIDNNVVYYLKKLFLF